MINTSIRCDQDKEHRQFIAYYRVSTRKQKQSGLGLDAQETTVQKYIAKEHGELLQVYTEVESGRKKYRPELAKAIRHAKATKSCLIIARLDRLARNVSFTANLLESEVEFVACDMPHANKFTIHVMAALAEQEAELISQRIKAALKEAKRRGTKLGNPRIQHIRKDYAKAAKAKQHRARARAEIYRGEVMKLKAQGARSLSDYARGLNQAHWYTSKGSRWDATRIRRLLGWLEIEV